MESSHKDAAGFHMVVHLDCAVKLLFWQIPDLPLVVLLLLVFSEPRYYHSPDSFIINSHFILGACLPPFLLSKRSFLLGRSWLEVHASDLVQAFYLIG